MPAVGRQNQVQQLASEQLATVEAPPGTPSAVSISKRMLFSLQQQQAADYQQQNALQIVQMENGKKHLNNTAHIGEPTYTTVSSASFATLQTASHS